MKRTTTHVGLDVHQSATVASVRQEDGKATKHRSTPLRRTPGPCGEVRLQLETAIHQEEGLQEVWKYQAIQEATF
jgi:hypothetical protein